MGPMEKKISFRLGGLYWIQFLDHFIGDDEWVKCEACGWVERSGPKFVKLIYWKTIVSSGDERTESENNESMKILRSAIVDAMRIE
jgi:uncharacterized Zn finger protein